jgi:regulator of protease activity HflC (stomatin/prohibitin superfamily)
MEKTEIMATITILGIFTVLVTGFSTYYTIDEGSRGVITRLGAVQGTATPGLNFKIPYFDEYREFNIKEQTISFEDTLAYSSDQQTASLKVTVNFSLNPNSVEKIYSEFGTTDSLVNATILRKVPQEVKNVFGKFTAVMVIQERERFVNEVTDAIKTSLTSDMFTIESVQVENIDFSDAYEQAIEDRMKAEVEVKKIEQNARRAKVDAEIVITQAKAQADSVKLKADAEAHAINVRGKALNDNPDLVKLTIAEKWDGKLPTSMIPNSSVPFLPLK